MNENISLLLGGDLEVGKKI